MQLLLHCIPGLYLLFQVVLHPHSQLVQLVPLLGQAHCAMLCILIVQDQCLFHSCTQVLDLLQLAAHGTDLLVLTLCTHTHTPLNKSCKQLCDA